MFLAGEMLDSTFATPAFVTIDVVDRGPAGLNAERAVFTVSRTGEVIWGYSTFPTVAYSAVDVDDRASVLFRV